MSLLKYLCGRGRSRENVSFMVGNDQTNLLRSTVQYMIYLTYLPTSRGAEYTVSWFASGKETYI